jgi:hypothetical protein
MNWKFVICRGGQDRPKYAANGDAYDSTLQIYQDGHLYKDIPYVNTDHRIGYAGGILAEGEYYGIVGMRKSGLKAIWIYRNDGDIIKSVNDLTIDNVTLKSLVPNANQGGDYMMRYILLHNGGISTDKSEGCLTTHPACYDDVFAPLQIQDKCKIILTRKEGWKTPAFYLGK